MRSYTAHAALVLLTILGLIFPGFTLGDENPKITFEFVPNFSTASQSSDSQASDSQPAGQQREYKVVRDGVALPINVKQQNTIALAKQFDPLTDQEQASLRLVQPANQIQQFVVQFYTQLISEYRALVKNSGLEVLGTRSKQVLLVRGTGAQASLLALDPRVRWVGQVLAKDKIDIAADLSNTGKPGYGNSVLPDQDTSQTKYNMRLVSLTSTDRQNFNTHLITLGGSLISQHPDSKLVTVALDPAQLEFLAASPVVEQLELWTAAELDMNNIRAITGSNFAETQAPILVPGLPNFTGNGVRGEVMDGPWVRVTHNAFNPNPIPHNVGGSGFVSDHATSTYGIVFGDGTSNANGRGQIPDGTGLYSSYFDVSDAQRAAHTAELVDNTRRAVFQTNSWGNSRTFSYTGISRDFDQMLFDNDVLVLQSQSNAGSQNSRPQAWSKNVLAIGGVRHLNNQNPNDDFWCTPAHALTCANNGAASIGPADDGRIKPDLANAYDSTLTTDGDFDSDYRTNFGGTSGATPITAGTAGIMYQMWAEGVLNGTPAPVGIPDTYVFANRPRVSTAKALLINTARQYPITGGGGQNIPRNIQGWGRANAEDLFVAAHNHGGALPIVIDEGRPIETGQLHAFSVTVADVASNPTDRWVKATLVYKDPPAAGNPALELVNDLTLRLTSPSGTIYFGNVGVDTGNWSSPGGSPDTLNNVENVFVENSEAGVWLIDVIGTDVGTDAHPGGAADAVYSLVVSCGGSNLCSDATLPVSLANFNSRAHGNNLTLKWLTANESFNVGFNLWGEIEGEWTQLNKRIVRSHQSNTMQAQKYRKRILLVNDFQDITRVGISSVDISGREEFYGPFEVGEEYGENFVPDPIDWQIVRNEHRARMQELGYTYINGRWRKIRHRSGRDRGAAEIEIDKPGIYRVSYEDLLAQNINWKNINPKRIALSYKNQAIPRHIVTHTNNKRGRASFGPGSTIDFYAQPPAEVDSLYTGVAVYQLSLEREKVANAGTADAVSEADSYWVYQEYSLGENKVYSIASPNNDPWMDASLFSTGSPAQKTYHFSDLPAAEPNQQATLKLQLIGGISLPGHPLQAPDHHIRVYLNGSSTPIADEVEDGLVNWEIDIPFDSNLLLAGDNSVSVEVVGDTGYFADIVLIDQLSLSIPTTAQTAGQALVFRAPVDASGISINGLRPETAIAYAFSSNHDLARLKLTSHQGSAQTQITVPTLASDTAQYWVSSVNELLSPKSIYRQIKVPSLDDLNANYLIIAHPNFINDKLHEYVSHRSAQGFNIDVINVLDIYQKYSNGMPLPSAIQSFIQQHAKDNPLTHLLLIGGNSYDYRNYLGLDSISFMPTFYSHSRDFGFFTPSDNPFSDLDGDDVPEIALGRWPVRTVEELAIIIDKSLNWQGGGNVGSEQSALLIAEDSDPQSFVSFANQVEEIGSHLVNHENQAWQNIEKIYLQPDSSTGEVKQQIIESINQGVTLTVFDGHASPGQWGRRNIFNQQDAKLFTDNNRATQVLSLACYTTFFDSPTTQTLAHQMLLASRGGAVAINGSITLGRYNDNKLMGVHTTHNQLAENMDIGTAIMRAKQRIGNSKRDAIVQWTLLGDPSLKIGNGN